ncbi:hypothetical protein PMI10_02259 [Flavobacterium sp. CF136]|nr:hypothetical protein PMI10_02259 [Flavobacterium sp. CF136]
MFFFLTHRNIDYLPQLDRNEMIYHFPHSYVYFKKVKRLIFN